MKILFLCSGDQPDYQCDVIYHGLKSLFGYDVESLSNMWYMYSDLDVVDRPYLYGLGFSLYGLLPADIRNIPTMETIKSKIRNKFYDLIIYGSAQRSRDLLHEVVECYPSNKVIFIDGEDYIHVDKSLLGLGIYFKRELTGDGGIVNPITFGIPEEKVIQYTPEKKKDWSYNYPGRLETYIFRDEESYYDDYRKSRYAVTFKKAGWDCLRHYEIIANGCIPYFPDIDDCPDNTMIDYPKKLQKQINLRIKEGTLFSDFEQDQILKDLIKHLCENMTTKAVVSKMLTTISKTQPIKSANLNVNNLEYFRNNYNLVNDRIVADSNSLLLYYGVGSISSLVDFPKEKIYYNERILSIVNSLKKIDSKSHFNDSCNGLIFKYIYLEYALTYISNLNEFIIGLRNNMDKDSRLIIVVHNFRTVYQLISILKNKFNFNRLKLSNSLPVNFFSSTSVKQLLNSYGFELIESEFYGVGNDSSKLKTIINRTKIFKRLTAPKILMTFKIIR